MDVLVDLLKDLLFMIIVWIVLFPVVMLMATPLILVGGLVGHPRGYFHRVRTGYALVFEVWGNL